MFKNRPLLFDPIAERQEKRAGKAPRKTMSTACLALIEDLENGRLASPVAVGNHQDVVHDTIETVIGGDTLLDGQVSESEA